MPSRVEDPNWNACTCMVGLVNGDGVMRQMPSFRWDCPSHGRDKAAKVREMCIQAAAERLWVGTFTQPVYDPVGPPPARHARCSVVSHVYAYADGSLRWRMLETCPHCCRYSSVVVDRFIKSVRRQWPGAQYLALREVKPQSGAFDVNIAIVGVPPLSRRTRAGRRVHEMWARAGGGFVDLGDGVKNRKRYSPGALGRYIGKYLTKHAHRPLAKGYRRMSRSRGFAPEVRMKPPPGPPTGDVWTWLGWVNPLTREQMPHGERWYPPPA